MNRDKKPGHFAVLKVIGFIAIFIAITGLCLIFAGFGSSGDLFIFGGFMLSFGSFAGAICLTCGFKPEISRLSARTQKYIQDQNKQDLADIANTKADIASDAITKTTKAIHNGLRATKYCKNCGVEIDADSKFCNICGEKQ